MSSRYPFVTSDEKVSETRNFHFVSAVINVKKPLNYRCHMGPRWIIPIMTLHILYVATLIVFTWAVRHIEFRFDELRDLWKGIIVSAFSIGI